MTPEDFTLIVEETKQVVLQAIADHLPSWGVDAIDDIAQETWLRAFKALTKKQFEGRSQMSTWLYVIAKNETLRYINRVARETRKTQKLTKKLNADAHFATVEPLVQDNISLLSLKENQRSVVELKLAGLNENEIAKQLGVSVGTVKSRFSRAKEKLARHVFESTKK